MPTSIGRHVPAYSSSMTTLSVASDPATLGFDSSRLSRLDRHFDRYVEDGRLAGWQLAVTRRGKIAHTAKSGYLDQELQKPLPDNAIWRIASMTKPITSVAAMMLWEQGHFELKDPVSNFIPEFANTLVWAGETDGEPDLVPQAEPMLMWHLMTHTTGMTYGFMHAHPVDAMYRKAGFDYEMPKDIDLAGLCTRLASLPLVFQPGAEWTYSMSIDVLGRIVEILSGMTLAEFMRQRLFEPLGMVDTAFSMSRENADRIARPYMAHPQTKVAIPLPGRAEAVFETPAAFLGGGGLGSTVHDYLRFAEMLRCGGELDGARILSPKTIALMTRNHLPGGADLTEFGRPLFAETTFDGVGFGLLGSVTLNPVKAKVPGSVGDFGWGGAFSTFFWVDPVEDLTCVFMTQILPSSTHPIRSQLKQLVHQALVD